MSGEQLGTSRALLTALTMFVNVPALPRSLNLCKTGAEHALLMYFLCFEPRVYYTSVSTRLDVEGSNVDEELTRQLLKNANFARHEACGNEWA